MRVKFLVGLAALALVFVFSVCACQKKVEEIATSVLEVSQKKTKEVDVSGIWQGQAEIIDVNLFTKRTDCGNIQFGLKLAQTGKQIDGEVMIEDGHRGISSGFIIDNDITMRSGIMYVHACRKGNSMEGEFSTKYVDDGGVGSTHKVTGKFKIERKI
jgi:hypothetical protein